MNPWTKADPFIVSTKATAEASFIQSNVGASSNNFEAVVLEGSNLVHYCKDNSTPGNKWNPMAVISSHASSAGCIIQSTLGASSNNFEVVVLEGSNLVHYYRDNSIPADGSPPTYAWSPKPTATISSQAVSSASLIQSDLGASHNNFEVVVLEAGGLGSQQDNLVHYYRDNGDASPVVYEAVLAELHTQVLRQRLTQNSPLNAPVSVRRMAKTQHSKTPFYRLFTLMCL